MKKESTSQLAFQLILPSLLCLLAVNIYPPLHGLWLSFQAQGIFDKSYHFVGLDNYRLILQDLVFWVALRNTMVFTIGTVAGSYLVGLIMAILLNQKMRGRGVFRALILLPWVMPTVVIAYTWSWMFHDLFGIINVTLHQLGLIQKPILWLADQRMVMGSLVAVNVWKAYPYMMVVLLAGLQSIPKDVYEAAAIDGASGWKQFTAITYPLFRPLTQVCTLYMFIWTFNYFDLVYLMTGGGPGYASHVLATYSYEKAFGASDYGLATSSSVIMLIMLAVMMAVYLRIGDRSAATSK